jgi:hypothetical protein
MTSNTRWTDVTPGRLATSIAMMSDSLVLAPDGKVLRYDEAEARRARVAPWSALGRDFYRELAWTVGRHAVERIRRFQDQACDADEFSASVDLRSGRQDVDVSLARIDGNTHVTIVQRTAARASSRT